MTLQVYSSVTYIVCVLDREVQQMGLESWLIVENVLPISTKKLIYLCNIVLLKHVVGPNRAHLWLQKCRKLDCSFAGGDQRGGAPPAADAAECAPQFY